MNGELARLAARVAEVERLLSRSTRTASLGYSSIEDGAVEVFDGEGSLRAVVGTQPDGTAGVNVVNGPPPPTPSAPVVRSVLGGVAAAWDGLFAEVLAPPLDLARVEIHAGPEPSFEPGPRTLAGTVETPQGGVVTVVTSGPVYVRLVARNTSGAASAPSSTAGPAGPQRVVAEELLDGVVTDRKIAERAVTAPHIKEGAVTVDHLAVGVTGNLVADPSFETGYTAGRIADLPGLDVVRDGIGSFRALRVEVERTTPRMVGYERFPVSPADRFWCAFDFKAAEDFKPADDFETGMRLRSTPTLSENMLLVLGWLDADGTVLDERYLSSGRLRPDGVWRRETRVIAAPEGAAYCVPRLQSPVGTGTVYFDNIEVRPVLSSATGGSRAELSPAGLRLFDAEGLESVSLVTGRPNYITLGTNGRPVATIDQSGRAAFSSLSVAAGLSVGGDPLPRLLDAHARGIVAIDYPTAVVTTGGTEFGYMELAFEADVERMYRIVFNAYADPALAGGEVAVVLRDGGAAPPTIASPQIQSITEPFASAGWTRVHLTTVRPGAEFGGGLHRLLVSFWTQAGPSGQTVRLLGGATYPGNFYVEDVGRFVPRTGVINTGGGGGPIVIGPKRDVTRTYAAAWSGTYVDRSAYTSAFGGLCLQGPASATQDSSLYASLIGFPAVVATDLAGATIRKAEVFVYFEHWYDNNGGLAVIKRHRHAVRPALYSSDPSSGSVSVPWGRNEGQWVDITSLFDSGTRGVALDPDDRSLAYLGRAQGVGSLYAPQLRVTYTK
ncbi:hypothetical protein [Streptomyces sp. NPDC091278]|uniref:hypothetical protein n=1 Tax=Streptomyces sp. NPDC091278 TaxID=3155301 RepID=UPI00344F5ADC